MGLVDISEVQSILIELFTEIHIFNMAKAATTLQEAEIGAQRLWEQQRKVIKSFNEEW